MVIGGGMCGLTVAFALLRRGVRRLRILDRAPEGREGPWVTIARMETIRSPKELTGPASGLASLTPRAWYEARFGREAWETLFRIPRPLWMEYLVWYRRVLSLPVENGVSVTALAPEGGPSAARDLGWADPRAAGRAGDRAGRDLAADRAGLHGGPCPARAGRTAPTTSTLPRLRGRRVVVVGAGAAAMDNAAMALEHGADSVRLVIRRNKMPVVNKLMGLGSAGLHQRLSAPRSGVALALHALCRAAADAGAAQLHPAGQPARQCRPFISAARSSASMSTGTACASSPHGGSSMPISSSCAPAFTVDVGADPLLGGAEVATWGDRYTPPPALASAPLARCPFLGPDFAFLERVPGTAPWLKHVHCFNHAASLSMGKVSGDIPRISEGAGWLADAISGTLFADDIEAQWQRLLDYQKPELFGGEWQDAEGDPT